MVGLDVVIIRLIIPLALFLVTVVRYNGFSFIYLLFLLGCPLLPRAETSTSRLKVQVFFILLITLSCIFTLSHLTLHIVLALVPTYDNALNSCSEISIAAQIGVQRLNGIKSYRAVRLVVPDIFILSVAVGALVYFSRRRPPGVRNFSNVNNNSSVKGETSERSHTTQDSGGVPSSSYSSHQNLDHRPKNRPHHRHLNRFAFGFVSDWDARRRELWRAWAVDTFGLLATVGLICATGITSPSLPNCVYLLSFLGICTYWACRSKISATPFAALRIFLLVYSGLHVCVYYLYQFPFFQSICKDGGFFARLLGLYYIAQTSCDKPGEVHIPFVREVDYITPFLTLLLYYNLVFETRRWLNSSGWSSLLPSFNANNTVLSPRQWTNNENEGLLEAVPIENAHELENLVNVPNAQQSVSSKSSTTPKTASKASLIENDERSETSPSSKTVISVVHCVQDESVSAMPSGPSVPDLNVTDKSRLQRSSITNAESDRIALFNDHSDNNPETPPPVAIKQDKRNRPKLSLREMPQLYPHFDALFGLTPPFLSSIHGTGSNNVRNERPLLLSINYSAIRNSYILTLIAMMAWAITYRSWLSFVLLLFACLLWITPDARTYCLYASPLIVVYAIVLILIQYVYGMNLTATELPNEVTPDGLKLSELGMKKWQNSVGALALQIAYLICFWLTLRLFVMERAVRRLQARTGLDWTPSKLDRNPWLKTLGLLPPSSMLTTPTGGEISGVGFGILSGTAIPFGTVDNSTYRKFTNMLRSLCVKYWIVVCCMSMLIISIQDPVVLFRIVYIVMLTYFMFLFQVSYTFWRKQMLFFWWVIVVYSMAMLLCIYTYQFEISPPLWKRVTGLSEEVLKDIGLETFTSTDLFVRLLTPVLFLVVIILQVHYFHKPFLEESSLDRFRRNYPGNEGGRELPSLTSAQLNARSPSESSSLSRRLLSAIPRRLSGRNRLNLNFMEDVNSAFQTVVSKLTSWAISLTNCLWRFLEVHWIKLLALVIMLNAVNEVTAPHVVSLIFMAICFPFPSLHGFLAIVIFVWTAIQVFCKMCFQLNFMKVNMTVSCPAPTNTTSTMDDPGWVGLLKVNEFNNYIVPLACQMVVCVMWHAIIYRQRQFYNNPNNVRPMEGIIFTDVTRTTMGNGLLNAVKFFFNYGFYRCGLELCHCVTVVAACLRADAFSVLYLILMFVFLFTRRDVCAQLWLPYLIVLAILIPTQYAACVGVPPGLCWIYPWIRPSVEVNNLLQWLFLPGMNGAPNAKKLTADFFQFIAVALQYRVFTIERHQDITDYGAGSNEPDLSDHPPDPEERDFVSSKESYLDYLRHAVFYWSYWVSLAIVLLTGVNWITLFCLGYMILSFIYLWMGQNVMLRKRENLIKSWNVIIGYNFCVILAKCSLQVIGCVYYACMAKQCWFIQLFGVQCTNPLTWSNFLLADHDNCPTVSSGLHWDVICFICILFQRKIFITRSFGHVVLDLNVQSQFASRGAYLINRKLMLVINEQGIREKRSLEKIREKLDVIQQRQEALGRDTANITEHYIMIRSGDYYLFEGDPEEDDENNFVHPPSPRHSPSADDVSDGEPSEQPPWTTISTQNPNMQRGFGTDKYTISPEMESNGKPYALSPNIPTTRASLKEIHRPPASTSFQLNGKQRHIMGALANVDMSTIDVLSNYTDPYSTGRSEKSQPDLGRLNNNLYSSMNSNRTFATDFTQARLLGHRRLHSHPECSPSFVTHAGLQIQHGLVIPREAHEHPGFTTPSKSLRSVKTSPTDLTQHAVSRIPHRQVHGETARRVHRTGVDTGVLTKRKPHQTHRRIVSASGSLPYNTDVANTAQPNPTSDRSMVRPSVCANVMPSLQVAPGQVSERSEPCELNVIKGIRSEEDGTKIPKVTSEHKSAIVDKSESGRSGNQSDVTGKDAPVKSDGNRTSHTTNTDNGDFTDDGQDADWDSDEDDDDANPATSPSARLNPLQLLNRAMELGACSTVRHYRRSLLGPPPSFHRSRAHPDSAGQTSSQSEDPHLMPHVTGSERNSFSGRSRGCSGRYSRPDEHRRASVQCITKKATKINSMDPLEEITPTKSHPLMLSEDRERTVNQCNMQYFPKRPAIRSIASVENWAEYDQNGATSVNPHSQNEEVKPPKKLKFSTPAPPRNGYELSPVMNSEESQLNPRPSVPFVDHPKVHTPSATARSHGGQRQKLLSPASASSKPSKSADQRRSDEEDGGEGSKPHSEQNPSSHDELGDADEYQHPDGCWSKFKATCLIAYMFVLSSMDSLIRLLNGLTRQYRRIRRTIDHEKRLVKRRVISNMALTQEQSRLQLEAAVMEVISSTLERPAILSLPAPSLDRQISTLGPALSSYEHLNTLEEDNQEREKAFQRSRSRIFLLLMALGNLCIVYSEWFCYSLLILNHMRSSTLISVFYPLIIFLWGMLSVPRPTKTFWTFLITYTEVVIVIKYIFQFKFISFNDPDERPSESSEALWVPRILGIDKHSDYFLFDLIQLISLFLHRGYLKNNGLWRDHVEFTQDLQLIAEETKAASSSGWRYRHHTKESRRRNSSDSSSGADPNGNVHNANKVYQPILTVPVAGWKRSLNPFVKFRRFYAKMTDPRYNKKVDVYIYMFLCEFISFWIMIFGYVSFGPSTGMGDNALEFIKSNRIPLPFIAMLLLQFIFIIIDRGLFLRKQVMGKFIFQIFYVLLIHCWLFFILPNITKARFTQQLAPQLLYVSKCIYFSLSAYQIRSGYPLRILGNFLTKNYSYLNLILFKGYLIIPFLYELRNVMDWMWTNSALSLYHWMELEDIYAKIFVLKCWRRAEIAYPTPRGLNRPAGKKALVGGLLLSFFFICFWGPMTISSFIGATFDFNPPVLCVSSLSFAGYPPCFEFTSREGNILQIPQEVRTQFTRCHEKHQETAGFLNNFESQDMRFITVDGFSGSTWAITQPSFEDFKKKLRDPKSSILVHSLFRCRRAPKEIQNSQTSVEVITSRPLKQQEKQQLFILLNGTEATDKGVPVTQGISATLTSVIPRYYLLRKDSMKRAYGYLGHKETYLNVTLEIHRDKATHRTWWEIKEETCSSDPCFEILRSSLLGQTASINPTVLSQLTFNERVSDSLFGKVFNNYGIIGMYAAYIFLANRLLRTIYSNTSYIVRLEELPHVESHSELVQRNLSGPREQTPTVGEQLVAKLIFLYRSSETMIKWTRHPRSIIDKFTAHPDANEQGIPPRPPPSNRSPRLPRYTVRPSTDSIQNSISRTHGSPRSIRVE
ncbi:unnamed protein product [Calicophoron daubneyi]|uniref:Piezo-type mechanosensitive ion channel component n=1 Tax=Calicophoron daubneyi TaxID=300641 RepID=A0AAV2T2S1_CALDB